MTTMKATGIGHKGCWRWAGRLGNILEDIGASTLETRCRFGANTVCVTAPVRMDLQLFLRTANVSAAQFHKMVALGLPFHAEVRCLKRTRNGFNACLAAYVEVAEFRAWAREQIARFRTLDDTLNTRGVIIRARAESFGIDTGSKSAAGEK